MQVRHLLGGWITVLPTADPEQVVAEVTAGLGADVVIEAVGVPETFELCARLVRASGHIANVGVHGNPVALHLESLWITSITITTGLVDTYSRRNCSKWSPRVRETHSLDHPSSRAGGHAGRIRRVSDAVAEGALKMVLTRS
jgi:threonine dehydrogenase-like Zn-dependent dehydrogenase